MTASQTMKHAAPVSHPKLYVSINQSIRWVHVFYIWVFKFESFAWEFRFPCSAPSSQWRENEMPSMQGNKPWTRFSQAPQGDSGRLRRAHPVQLAQPSMDPGSGWIGIKIFVLFSSLSKTQQHPPTFSIILLHISMSFVRSPLNPLRTDSTPN